VKQPGVIHHWVASYFPIAGAHGKARAVGCLIVETTELKRAQQALRDSEELFRLLFENSHDGINLCESRLEGDRCVRKLVYCNKRFVEMSGRTEAELMACPDLHTLTRDIGLPEQKRAFMESMRNDRPAQGIGSWNRPDGKETYHEWVAVPLQRNGNFLIMGIDRDITERKRTEDALRESENQFRSLFENSPDAVFVEDENGVVLDANPAACRLQELDREQLIGKNVLELVPEAEQEQVKQGFRKWFSGERTGRDSWTRTAIGRHVPVAIKGSRIVYRGKPAILLHVRDVTERRQAEEALRELSVQLLRSQDEERRRIARELHDATGQKLAAMAMYLSRTSESAASLDSGARDSLAESVTLLDRVVEEVRTLSYLLFPPLLDERGLASALRWYVDGFTQRSGMHVNLDVSPDLQRLPQEIETVVFRIVQEGLTNAHRHSESSTAAIRLQVDSAGVTLEVRDAGKGLPSQRAAGVGIPGMRERVNHLGGRMDIESATDGTTIRVTLPFNGDKT